MFNFDSFSQEDQENKFLLKKNVFVHLKKKREYIPFVLEILAIKLIVTI